MTEKLSEEIGSEDVSEAASPPMAGAEIRAVVQELDEALEESDPGFAAACILLASFQLGPDSDRIAAHLDLPHEEVEACGQNLRASGIWGEQKIHTSCFTEDGLDGFAFWMEVLVAQGLVQVKNERPAKFVHPENAELTWTGRGRRPFWLKDLLSQGVELESLRAAG